MINHNININNNFSIDIINEFRNLIDFINLENVLIEKSFQILKKYFRFETAGIFFNTPDIHEVNNLHLLLTHNNIDKNYIRTCFFNEISKHKQVLMQKITPYYQSSKPEVIKKEIYKDELILPITYDNKLLGGICIFSKDNILKCGIETFNLIINEFFSIFKLKYMFTEQIYKSNIDSLTGLYNRNQFDISLKQEFNRGKRYNKNFSIAMIDIDFFKKINDTFGHQFGDYVLTEIPKIIRNSLRKTDIVYRYGGEEIAIIMPETTSEEAYKPLKKLKEKISLYNFKGKRVTISIGLAENKDEFNDSTALLKQADRMLYKAKESGRNKICL